MKINIRHSLKMSRFILIVFILTLLVGKIPLKSQTKERSQIPDKYKWNLTDIYASIEDWQKDKKLIEQNSDKITSFKGTLNKSGKHLLTALNFIHDLYRKLDKLSLYTQLLADQDLRKSGPIALKEEVNQIYTNLGSKLSYWEPELLSIPESKMKQFMKEESQLKTYKEYLERIQRRKPHTGCELEEKIIAEAGIMSGVSGTVHSVFNNAEMPYQVEKFSDGFEVAVDVPTYEKYRCCKNREDRIKVFNAFFGALDKFKGTYGALLYGQIKENLFYKKVCNFDSFLDLALFYREVPQTVVTNLIKNVHKYLPYLHRYLKIRKQLLGVKELHYYDFYPDLIEGIEFNFPFEEGKVVLKKALKVLGEEYGHKLEEAYNNRWIDAFPSPGKDSGAQSSSSYDTHPFIKLNYNGKYADLSMMAHELGHAMHSYYSDKTQPYVNSNYSYFVAELAANTNEAILTEYLIKTIKDPKKRLTLIGSFLEEYRMTVFRQTLFAEFELKINQLAEQGKTLSADNFNQIYLELLKKYYGHNEGFSVIDDLCGIEWAYIHHFYLRFYHFMYSTTYTGALALAEKMTTGGEEMVKKYINFLSSGSSELSIPMLKKLGIDMTGDEVFELAMANMKKLMDEMEVLLKAQP